MFQAKINEGKNLNIKIKDDKFFIDGEEAPFTAIQLKENLYQVARGRQVSEVEIRLKEGKTYTVTINGNLYDVELKDTNDLLLEKMGLSNLTEQKLHDIRAPMPGLVLKIFAEPGQEIAKDEPVLVLEAMKMENVLKSPGAGVVKSIEVTPGSSVEKNQVLIVFE